MREIWSHEWNKHLGNIRLWLVLIALLILTGVSTLAQLSRDKYNTTPMSQETYDEYRKNVISDAEKKLTISIFAANNDEFVIRNAHKIIEKYTECEDIKVEKSVTQGVRVLCDSIYENIILLFWVLFCVNIVIFEEKKIGQYSLQRTTKYGRMHLGIIKQLVLVLMAEGGMLLTVLVRLTVLQLTVGLGNVQRSIQSVYPESIVHMSVLDVIVKSIFLKGMAVIVVACLIFWLSQFLKSGFAFIWATTVLFVASLAVYIFVPGNSWLSLSKELNVWTFLNSTITFTRYKNLSVFSNPIDYRLCSVCVMIVLTVIFGITSGIVYGRKTEAPLHRRADIHLLNGRHTYSFLHEGYKLIFIAGWWIIIFALPMGMLSIDEKYYKYDNLSDYYEMQYCNLFEDEWNSDYDRTLSEEIEKAGGIEIVENNILGLPQLTALDRINKKAVCLNGIENGYMLYEKGYHKLLITQNSAYFMKQMLVIGILILIAMGTIWFVEVKYDQIRILRTTRYGLKRVRLHKILYAVLLSTIVYSVAWSLPLYRIFKTYGNLNMSAASASLEVLARWKSDMSIGAVLGIQFFILYIITIIFALTMMKIIGMILGGNDYE